MAPANWPATGGEEQQAAKQAAGQLTPTNWPLVSDQPTDRLAAGAAWFLHTSSPSL